MIRTLFQYLGYINEKYCYGRPDSFTFEDYKAESYAKPQTLSFIPSVVFFQCSNPNPNCKTEWGAAAVYTHDEQLVPLVQDGEDRFCPNCRKEGEDRLGIIESWGQRGAKLKKTIVPGEPLICPKQAKEALAA